MAAIDPNTWYQVTESRVGFSSSLQFDGSNMYMAALKPAGWTGQYWQFLPIGNGAYQIRNMESELFLQLATCQVESETDPSKTQPCMKDARGYASQQWTITPWGDGTYQLQNVGNGTNYNMDCHPGNPLFMSSTIAVSPVQPAQHWAITSFEVVNNAAYSTAITAVDATSAASQATTTAAGAAGSGASQITGSLSKATGSSTASGASTLTPNGQSSNNGGQNGQNGQTGNNGNLSSASTGIGIGVGLGVGLILSTLAVLFFLWYRRRRSLRWQTWRGLQSGEFGSDMAGAGMGRGGTNYHSRIASELNSRAFAVEKDTETPRHEMFVPTQKDKINDFYVPPVELPTLNRGVETKTKEEQEQMTYHIVPYDENT